MSTSLHNYSAAERFMAMCAIAGPVIFCASWISLGFFNNGYVLYDTRVDGYSWVSQPISGLGLGSTALLMNTAFIGSGVLLFVGVVGCFRVIRPLTSNSRGLLTVLFCLTPLGLILDGVFTLEAFILHFLGFGIGVGSLPIVFAVVGAKLKSIPEWSRFGGMLVWASPLTLLLIILQFATFDYDVSTGINGLVQRILIVEALAWFVALGWLSLRRSRRIA
ncbi:DUF998 domain-containing protein [Nocardia brasiliensis]